jgi:hypothetical protein
MTNMNIMPMVVVLVLALALCIVPTEAAAHNHNGNTHTKPTYPLTPNDAPQIAIFPQGGCLGEPATAVFAVGLCFQTPVAPTSFPYASMTITVPGDGSGQFTVEMFSDTQCQQKAVTSYGIGTECEQTFNYRISIPEPESCQVDIFAPLDNLCQLAPISTYNTVHDQCLRSVNPNAFSGSFDWTIDMNLSPPTFNLTFYKDENCENEIAQSGGNFGACVLNRVFQCTSSQGKKKNQSIGTKKIPTKHVIHAPKPRLLPTTGQSCTVVNYATTDYSCAKPMSTFSASADCLMLPNPNNWMSTYQWSFDFSTSQYSLTYFKDTECQNPVNQVVGQIGECQNNMIVKCESEHAEHNSKHTPTSPIAKIHNHKKVTHGRRAH